MTISDGLSADGVDDRHSDASLRALVTQIAYLGCLVAYVLDWLVTTDVSTSLRLSAVTTVGLVFTELSRRFGWVRTGSRQRVFAVVVAYAVFIVTGTAVVQTTANFGLLQVVPVVFGAFFFAGPARYVVPLLVPLLEFAALAPYGNMSWREALARLVVFMLMAHFSVRIVGILGEAVRAHRSLHAVLEAATSNPFEPDLAERGLHAALDVVAWDAGAVALVDGDRLVSTASSGLTVDLDGYDARNPALLSGSSTAAIVVRTGRQTFAPDARKHFEPGHPLLVDGIRCVAGTPIPSRGEVIGVLVTAHRSPRSFDERERDRLTAVAEQLGLALGSSRAWRREAEVTEGLRALNRRKDEFLAAVSHELRTPATTIELAARTLHRGGDRLQKPEREAIVLSLLRRSRDLREMIESLLELALSESGDNRVILSPLDWQFCLTRWVAELSQQHARRVELDMPEETVVAMADAAKMERVLSSLVSNAVKFSPDDCPVRVRLDADPDADDVRLSVEDKGMGILPEDLDRIFQRFLQLDGSETREANGLGIGLTLVRHFVSLHGGTVTVDSSPGVGSTFVVSIPRHRTPTRP
ncbi:MAG: sensor hybrid histidine kinase [Frankiales bacterium]|nr:sensor hybrid histidine kinase [Frankiales bacterium]